MVAKVLTQLKGKRNNIVDTKNVIAAISLSAAVIILYSLFFAPPAPDPKQIQKDKNTVTETTDAPSLDQNDETIKISRSEALKEVQRVGFENENIKGSISLTGAVRSAGPRSRAT